MTIRGLVTLAVVLGASSAAFAESATPEQKAACGADVHRFCSKLRQEDGGMAYIQCLQTHRVALSLRCRDLMAANGV
jgi:hypothetical protein